MANIDLSKLSVKELKTLQKNVEVAIIDNEKRMRREALTAAQAVAKEFGFSLEDLLDASPRKKSRGVINPAKYQHPENPSVTWTGKGRQPAWIKEAMEAGTSLDSFLIE